MKRRWALVGAGLGLLILIGAVSGDPERAPSEQAATASDTPAERTPTATPEPDVRAEARRLAKRGRYAQAGAEPSGSGCDANYAGACLKPDSPDYDCAGGSGDGPDYTGPVQVVGTDHYGLDRDGDGAACEG